MSWKYFVCLCVIVIGVILFLYGSNYYDAVVGWAGVCLMVGGFFAVIIVKVYERVKKGSSLELVNSRVFLL